MKLLLKFMFATLFLFSSCFAAQATAIFAAGCFWCVQADFNKVPGVLNTIAGYTGGTSKNPTYQQVSSGTTNYVEAVEVFYDPSKVSYADLLQVYWHNVDPMDANGQFCDKGNSYKAVIFYSNITQHKLAEQSKQLLLTKFKINAVKISPATTFYPAEDYHQNYYKKNPIRYKFYRLTCGRDQRLKELWAP